MKAIIVIIVMMGSVTVCAQQTTTKYDDGAIRSEGLLEGDKKIGKWTFFYPDGTISSEEDYVGGQLDGIVLNYDFSGNLIARENWSSGVLNDSSWYFKEGSLWRKGVYSGGVYEGTWLYYFPNGNIEQVGEYENGLPNGNWRTYDEDGKLLEEGTYVDGLPDGEWKFYENGTLSYFGRYKAGEPVGDWFRILKNGKKKLMK